MTSFVHVDYPSTHPGVQRAQAVYAGGSALLAALRKFIKTYDGSRSLAGLLLGAVVSALVVVADHLIDSWADGHLLAAWVVLWLVAFIALALLTPVAKTAVTKGLAWMATAREQARQARSEAAYLEAAQRDPRVMAELHAAILRHEADQIEQFGEVEPNASLERLTRSLPANKRYLRYV
jgi:hypothetical protein